MVTPTLSLTEFQEFKALVAFLNGIVPTGTVVIRGQQNRTAEPQAANFIVAWPLRYERLSTNIVYTFDDVITASIAGSVMTVTSIAQLQQPLVGGLTLTDGTVGLINGSTTIVAQLSGSIGGTGAYQISPSQNLVSGTLYAGQRTDLTPSNWVVQCDVHGPNSANAAIVLMSLFRSEYGVDAFAASGFEITPLYCDEARYQPFVNAEQAYEYRWTVDVTCYVSPIVGTTQQFADQLDVTTVEVDIEVP